MRMLLLHAKLSLGQLNLENYNWIDVKALYPRLERRV
jgi:hypothetical protein